MSLLLGNWKHLSVAASPELALVWFKPSVGSDSGSTTILALQAAVEAEIHLGFVGVPALSIGLLAGLGFQYESVAGTRLWSVGVLGGDSVSGRALEPLRQVLPLMPRKPASRQRSRGTPRAAGRGGHRANAAPDGARIAERIPQDDRPLYLVGVRTGGAYSGPPALRHAGGGGQGKPILGAVDISLYRDDVLPRPAQARDRPDRSARPIERRHTIVLVDDVLFTGPHDPRGDGRAGRLRPPARREAGGAGRSRLRELPIQPDFVGLALQTTARESVRVMLAERGEPDRVVLRERPA